MSLLEKFKNKKVIIVSSIILAISLGAGIFIYNKNKKQNEEILKAKNSIETYTIADNEKVFINGKILPTETKNFNPSLEGEISKLNVTDGKIVKKGDLLYTCKNESILNEIDSLKSQINELKKLDNDPLINTEISKLNAQVSALDKKAYLDIYAPFDGKVYLDEHSNSSSESSSFMTLQSNTFYMKGQTSEQDLPKLQIEDAVNILIFSTGKTVTGKVSFISDRPSNELNNTDINSHGNLSYYDIRISFDNQENLVNGFHVQASIEIRNPLSKIPTSSILQDKDDEYYVFRSLNGILKKQTVEIYDENEEFTIVNSGLDKKDVIIKNPSSDMQEGDSIKIDNSTSNLEGEDDTIE